MSWSWAEGGEVLGETARLTTVLEGVGAHVLTLTVCDAAGNCSGDDVVVTITTSQMACFATHKANLKLDAEDDDSGSHDDSSSTARAKGHLHIDGRYTLSDCSEVDLAIVGATLRVDAETYVVPEGGFVPIDDPGHYRYVFAGADDFGWTLTVGGGRWRLHTQHHDTTGLSPADGLALELLLGDQVGREDVAVAAQGRQGRDWKYHAQHDTLCGWPWDDDDDSSSHGDDDDDSDAGDDDSDGDDAGTAGLPSCGACSGKVTELTLRYDGDAAAWITVTPKRSPAVFEGTVGAGQQFSFSGNDRWGTLGSEIELEVNGRRHARPHTSCSREIGVGSTYGDFTVLAGASRNGGPLCPID